MKIDKKRTALLANTIRMLSLDGVEKANSGHPGLPLGAADFSAVLWSYFLKFDPSNPGWMNRDRFVLSGGHGSMLLYSLLHLFGYADMPLRELQNFRQWNSKTPGHPEYWMTAGVETTTGPLGQGFGNGVGMALSARLLAERYSKELFDYRVYALVSDGDLMEGVASEAASLAGHLALGNLIYLYDSNHISLAGTTKEIFTEKVSERFNSYGWFVQEIDGHDLEAAAGAIAKAQAVTDQPSIIVCNTHIGYGSPNKADSCEAHGAPLGKEEQLLTRRALGWLEDRDFFVPDDVKAYCGERIQEKKGEYQKWQKAFESWSRSNPDKLRMLEEQRQGEIPAELENDLIAAFGEGKKDATRNLSGQAIQVIAKRVPGFIGGSADLEPSTKTMIKGSPDIQENAFAGRNIRFGVREHAMGSMANGLAATRDWIPYTATFLVFSDYMRPTIRLAALSHFQVLFIFTHDSFYVGEDGPTHEPIEQTASLRLIPNLAVYRPADGLETGMSYLAALRRKHGPSTLLFTRQSLPPLKRPSGFKHQDILKGGYIVADPDVSDLVLVATGSEVSLCVEAAKILEAKGKRARVVSLPCVEDFMAQPKEYRESIIPSKARRVSVEAGVTTGWESVVGSDALLIGIDRFGASAPAGVLAEKFGFTPAQVAARIESWMA